MTALLLEPHQDDAALFCAYACLREKPHVVTVLRDANGAAAEREAENEKALAILGCTGEQWTYLAGENAWGLIENHLRVLDDGSLDPPWSHVFAPYPENAGHPEHNAVGELAREVFGDRVTYYTTYRYGGPRTTGTLVPYEREWVIRKLRALACYESQVLRGPVRFFTMGLDEYTMP